VAEVVKVGLMVEVVEVEVADLMMVVEVVAEDQTRVEVEEVSRPMEAEVVCRSSLQCDLGVDDETNQVSGLFESLFSMTVLIS